MRADQPGAGGADPERVRSAMFVAVGLPSATLTGTVPVQPPAPAPSTPPVLLVLDEGGLKRHRRPALGWAR